MKFDVFKAARKIPSDFVRRKVLDTIFNVSIPFNFSLGLHLKRLSPDRVEVTSHNGWRTKNHVGGAHACFLALLGEYPAGLLLAQHFSVQDFRIIIGELHVEYFKQGRGFLKGVARKPDVWPEFKDDQVWVPMITDVFNKEGEMVASVKTQWQIKKWSQVRSPSSAES